MCFDLLYVTHDCYVPTDVYNHKRFDSDLPAAEGPEDCSSQCSCGNVAVIVDEDTTWYLYVEDIRTTQRAILYHNGDFKEVHRELLSPFGQAVFTDYSKVRHTPLNFETPSMKKYYDRKTSTQYDKKLVSMLDRHKYHTTDGGKRIKR